MDKKTSTEEENKIKDVVKHLEHSLEPKPRYGDLFTLQDFITYVKHGAFMDDDGTGYYAISSGAYSRIHQVLPSDIRDEKIDKSWTHVMWFNR